MNSKPQGLEEDSKHSLLKTDRKSTKEEGGSHPVSHTTFPSFLAQPLEILRGQELLSRAVHRGRVDKCQGSTRADSYFEGSIAPQTKGSPRIVRHEILDCVDS